MGILDQHQQGLLRCHRAQQFQGRAGHQEPVGHGAAREPERYQKGVPMDGRQAVDLSAQSAQ